MGSILLARFARNLTPHPCMLCTCFTCFFFYLHVNKEAVSSLYIVFFLLPSLANPTPHFCVLWAHFTCFFFCTCIYREAVNSLFSSNHLHQEDMIGCWSVEGKGGHGVREGEGSGVSLCGLSGGGTGVLMIGNHKAPLTCITRNLAQ